MIYILGRTFWPQSQEVEGGVGLEGEAGEEVARLGQGARLGGGGALVLLEEALWSVKNSEGDGGIPETCLMDLLERCISRRKETNSTAYRVGTAVHLSNIYLLSIYYVLSMNAPGILAAHNFQLVGGLKTLQKHVAK